MGPRLALSLLSSLGANRVARAVADSDIAALCTVSGVGKKKAERLVLELKDRMRDLEVDGRDAVVGSLGEQTIKALINLGYGQLESDHAVRTMIASNGAAPIQEVLKGALELLSGK